MRDSPAQAKIFKECQLIGIQKCMGCIAVFRSRAICLRGSCEENGSLRTKWALTHYSTGGVSWRRNAKPLHTSHGGGLSWMPTAHCCFLIGTWLVHGYACEDPTTVDITKIWATGLGTTRACEHRAPVTPSLSHERKLMISWHNWDLCNAILHWQCDEV